MNRLPTVAGCTGAGLAPLVFLSLAMAQPPYEIVFVEGDMSETQGLLVGGNTPSTGLSTAQITTIAERICKNRNAFKQGIGIPVADSSTLDAVPMGNVLGVLANMAIESAVTEEQKTALNLYDGFCGVDRDKDSSFQIVYSKCSMLMLSNQAIMRLVLPTDGGTAEMQFGGLMERTANFEAKYEYEDARDGKWGGDDEYYNCRENANPVDGIAGHCDYMAAIHLRRKLEPMFQDERAKHTPLGNLVGKVKVDPKGGGGSYLGVPTSTYSFEYEGEMKPGAMFSNSATQNPEGISFGKVHTITEGTAAVAPDAPGAHIVADFYSNFADQVVTDERSDTLIGGMIYHQAKLSEYGMPLHVTQESATRITGLPTFGQKFTSETTVTGVGHFLSNAEWCASSVVPEDFELVTWEDLMQPGGSQSGPGGGAPGPGLGASGPGAGAGASMPGGVSAMSGGMGMSEEQAAEMANAMQQYSEAMENMTPEQQQMMEQMGVGNMLDQMMGGGMADAQPPATNPRASSSSAGSNMPPAEELNSGNLTESVQRHLQALGYDVGETYGEMSLSTEIAISTFQSEKKMDVTGKVSPQLLGILSAEVDKRR